MPLIPYFTVLLSFHSKIDCFVKRILLLSQYGLLCFLIRPCVSWIKSTYALADYFIVPNKKPENDIYKTTKDENAVTIKTVFEHSDRLVSEYRESGYRFSKKLVWSLEIEVLSRDSDRIKHKCSNGKIIEYDSAGYGIREHFGDIDTKECRTGKTE